MALNITTAVIGSGCNAATASPSLAQWDKGQILQISGVELPETYKVEFSNGDTLEAIPAIGTAEGVEIPDKLLYSSSPIRAYIVLSEAESERNTEYWVTIYVKPREIPEDIEPTPAQQDVIDDLIAQLNTGVGKAEAAADAAEESAGEAEAASQAVQDLGVRAETAASGAPAAVQKIVDAETGAVTLVFSLPQGEAGVSPVVTVTTITGGHRVTVTDDSGAHTFDVMDGRSVTGVTMGADYKLTFTFSDGTTWTTPTSIRGETGATPRLTIGTVSTLDPGQSATAEITGTPEDPVLNLGIPKGQAGASDAGSVTYDPTETYQSGTAGAALNDLSRQLSDKADKDALNVEDIVVNDAHNYINYGYDTPQFREPQNVSNSLRVGFNRIGQTITLNGGGHSKDIVLKLNNTVQTTDASSTVKTWEGSVLLKSGRNYRVTCKLLSGTVSDLSIIGVSIYKSGAASTSGVGFANEDHTVFGRSLNGDDGLYNIALYITKNVTFTDAKFLIYLEDITNSGYTISDLFEYCDSKTNGLHNLVAYYDNKRAIITGSGSTGSATSVSVERLGTFIKLNYAGNTTSSHVKRVKISGELARSDSITYESWARDFQLTEGKEYRFKIKKISGASKLLNDEPYFPSLVAYKVGSNSSILTMLVDELDYKEYSLVAPSGGMVVLGVYFTYNSVLTDLVIEVTLEEYQSESSIADYYVSEMTDTVEKVRNEITSPSMVFLWATDIHRLSSNAAVQTFSKMIANMDFMSGKVPCNFILDTGDLTDGDVVQATTISRAYDCLTEFRSIGLPYVWAMGNHDTNPYINSGANVLTMDECYKAYFSAMMDVTYNASESGTDYYLDFNGLDVRLISLNANNVHSSVPYAFSTNTATWLATALNTQKTVFVVLHQSPYTAQIYDNTATTNAAGIRTALESFVSNGGNLIMLSGHSHCDVAFISPFLSIMQNCQRFSSIDEDITDEDHGMTGFIDVVRFSAREQGTATEDCWSVGVYKPDSNELSLIRFGAGKDRYFHVTPIAPTTVTTKLTGTITWTSSDAAVATVTDGVITGVATGKCAVLAKDETGNYECWIVEVT